MELNEAIAHCEEKASELIRRSTELDVCSDCEKHVKKANTKLEAAQCRECAREHEQLADWLRELRAFRKAHEMIAALPIGTGVLLAWEIMNDCLKEAKKCEK